MKNTQRGVAIVEFALVLPTLLILTFITTEFGRATGVGLELNRLNCELLSDQAWCRAQMDQREESRADALAAEAGLIPETQIDDRAATHSRLALTYAALGDQSSASRH